MEPGGRRNLAIRESMSQSDSQNWVHPIFGMKLFLRRGHIIRSPAVPGSNGVCGQPRFGAPAIPLRRARLASGRHGRRPSGGRMFEAESFICCGPTIPQVWSGMSCAGLEDRRTGAGGQRSIMWVF